MDRLDEGATDRPCDANSMPPVSTSTSVISREPVTGSCGAGQVDDEYDVHSDRGDECDDKDDLDGLGAEDDDNDETLHSKTTSINPFLADTEDDVTSLTSLTVGDSHPPSVDDATSLGLPTTATTSSNSSNPFVGDDGIRDAISVDSFVHDSFVSSTVGDDDDVLSFASTSRDVSLPDFTSSIDETTPTFSVAGDDDEDVIGDEVGEVDSNSLRSLTLPDLTSPEPAIRVTGNEVRRAAALLRGDEPGDVNAPTDNVTDSGGLRQRRRKTRRSSLEGAAGKEEERENSGREEETEFLKAPTSDYLSLSRSASPASGALRQISQRLCDSVTSLESVSTATTLPHHALDPQQQAHRSHRPKLSRNKRLKVDKILTTLSEDPSDVSTIRQLAISRSGLVSNDVRALAWPKLLNVDPKRKLRRRSWEELTGHRDYDQVVLDVRRSLRRFPPGLTEEEQQLLQVKLNTLILRVLCEHQELHYYQGYHDICVTFLLAVGEDLAFALMDRLSTHHLRDFMDKTMERTTHLLNYLLPLVGRVNPALRDYVEAAGVGTVFSLSWLITWYGHVLNELKNIVRLYDFFLACHPLMPLYLAAAIVIHRERDILDTECDFAMLHCTLSKVPEDLPWETLISKAGDYFIQFPPSELAAEAEWIYQKGVAARESRISAAASKRGGALGGRGRGGQLMTRNQAGAWIPLNEPKKAVARVVMWTLYASVGAAAYAVYSAGGFNWLWSGS